MWRKANVCVTTFPLLLSVTYWSFVDTRVKYGGPVGESVLLRMWNNKQLWCQTILTLDITVRFYLSNEASQQEGIRQKPGSVVLFIWQISCCGWKITSERLILHRKWKLDFFPYLILLVIFWPWNMGLSSLKYNFCPHCHVVRETLSLTLSY